MFWLWLIFEATRSEGRNRYEETKYLSALSLAERRAYVEKQREEQRKAKALEDTMCYIFGGLILLVTLIYAVPHIWEVHKAL